MSFLQKLIPGRVVGDAAALYGRLVAQARQPVFYTQLGAPDTVGGRFDMIALHAYIVMRRLKELGGPGGKLAQAVFDAMFADMDRNLREMGVGDLRVGRQVKDLAKSFYGRIKAYDEGLVGGTEALDAALVRNLYADAEPQPTPEQLAGMAAYLQGAVARSRSWDIGHLGRAEIDFPPAIRP